MARNRAHLWLLLTLLCSLLGFSSMHAMAPANINWLPEHALSFCLHMAVKSRIPSLSWEFFTLNAIPDSQQTLKTALVQWLEVFNDSQRMLQMALYNQHFYQLNGIYDALKLAGISDLPKDMFTLLQRINLICPIDQSNKQSGAQYPIWYNGNCVEVQVIDCKNNLSSAEKDKTSLHSYVLNLKNTVQPFVKLHEGRNIYYTPYFNDSHKLNFEIFETEEPIFPTDYVYKVVLHSNLRPKKLLFNPFPLAKQQLQHYDTLFTKDNSVKVGTDADAFGEIPGSLTSSVQNERVEDPSLNPFLSVTIELSDIEDNEEYMDFLLKWKASGNLAVRPHTEPEDQRHLYSNGVPTVGDVEGTPFTTEELAQREQLKTHIEERRKQAAAANRRLVMVVLALVFLLVLVLCAIAWTYAVSRRLAREQQEAARRRQKRSTATVPV